MIVALLHGASRIRSFDSPLGEFQTKLHDR